MNLLEISFTVSVMILFIGIIRIFTVKFLPKRVFILLWEAVLCRLFLPIPFPSRFSIYNKITKTETIVPDILPFYEISDMSEKAHIDIIQITYNPFPIWKIIWISGIILFGLFFLFSYIKCKKKFYQSSLIENTFITKWIKEHKIIRPIQVKQTDKIVSPLTYNIFFPIILLPQKMNLDNQQQLTYILTHEYIHIRHFDIVRKLLAAISLCIYWFNPFIWVMYFFFNRDIELFCDETVIKISGEKTKSEYALTLVDMEEEKKKMFTYYNQFSKYAIEERVELIMKMKKNSMIKNIFSFVFVIVIVAVLGTTAVAADKKTKQDYKKEYKKAGILVRNNHYYYKENRIRIFIDLRANQSFENFVFDSKGSIDIKVIRNKNGSITKTEFIPKEEVKEILSALDYASVSNGIKEMVGISSKISKNGFIEDIDRLTKEDVSNSLLKILNSCKKNKWYIIEKGNRQYIYYSNLTKNYAYQFKQKENKLIILDIGKTSKDNYVLLSIPKNSQISIYYNSEIVNYTKIKEN